MKNEAWTSFLSLIEIPNSKTDAEALVNGLAGAGVEYLFCVSSKSELGYATSLFSTKSRENSGVLFDDILKRSPNTRLVNAPISPDRNPEDLEAYYFWEHAFAIALSISERSSVGICSAKDLSRTGFLAAAVLMVLGSSWSDAVQVIENEFTIKLQDEQNAFLAKGIRERIEEPSVDSVPVKQGNLSNDEHAREMQRRAKEYFDAPKNEHRNAYNGIVSARSCHPSLSKFGLSSVVNPASDGWAHTTGNEKLEALHALYQRYVPEKNQRAFSIATKNLLVDLFGLVSTYTSTTTDDIVMAGTVLLQSAVDPKFSLPVSTAETSALSRRYTELLDGRKTKGVQSQFSKAEIPALGRHEFDPGAHEWKTTSIDEKFDHITRVVNAEIPLLDAVMLYKYWYRNPNRKYVLRELPAVLFEYAMIKASSR